MFGGLGIQDGSPGRNTQDEKDIRGIMWGWDFGVRVCSTQLLSKVSTCEDVNEEHDTGLKVQVLGMLGWGMQVCALVSEKQNSPCSV